MKPAEYWIDHLHLQPHPEGGFYRETYRSGETIPQTGWIAGPVSRTSQFFNGDLLFAPLSRPVAFPPHQIR